MPRARASMAAGSHVDEDSAGAVGPEIAWMLSGDWAGSATMPVARDGSLDGSAVMYSPVPADAGASDAAAAGSVDVCSSPPPPAVSTSGGSLVPDDARLPVGRGGCGG